MVSNQWVRYNWRDVIGIPTPDAGPWILRDTPIDRGALEKLKRTWKVEKRPGGSTNGNTAVMGSKVRPKTTQMLYETVRDAAHQPYESVIEQLADCAPVSRDVVEAFSADPTADLYAVEVIPNPAVTSDVRRLQDEHGLDVQLIGVGREEPEDYPGAFVEVDRETLADPSSDVLRAIPAGDLLITSPFIEFSHLPRELFKQDVRPVLNPGNGDLVDVVVDDFLLTNDVPGDDGGDGDGDGDGGAPGVRRPVSDAQQIVQEYMPDVMVSESVEIEGEGQVSLGDAFG